LAENYRGNGNLSKIIGARPENNKKSISRLAWSGNTQQKTPPGGEALCWVIAECISPKGQLSEGVSCQGQKLTLASFIKN